MITFEIEVDGWERVKQAALTTIHKKYAGGEITQNWKKNILMSRHSPIRELRISVHYKNIPRWIADQLVRHTVGVNNYMGTMRSDRGNVEREKQTMADTTELLQVFNGESFLKMMSTRLCFGAVSVETRKLIERVRDKLFTIDPAIALFCTPPCISNLGCKEAGFLECCHFLSFCNRMIEELSVDEIPKYIIYNIRERCEFYHGRV